MLIFTAAAIHKEVDMWALLLLRKPPQIPPQRRAIAAAARRFLFRLSLNGAKRFASDIRSQ